MFLNTYFSSDKSNWIGLLPLGDQNSANVWLYEENQELFAITTETVPLRKPLKLGYSKQYADDYGLIGPTKEIRKGNYYPLELVIYLIYLCIKIL